MREEYLHVADEELLLHASGELPAGRSGPVSAHLGCCSHCHARLKELENTLTEFSETYLNSHDADLLPAAGPRALLKSRLAEQGREHRFHPGGTAFVERRQAVVLAGVVVAVCFLLAIQLYGPGERSQPRWASLGLREEPNLRLTPGATVPVTVSEVCGGPATMTVPVVPVSLRR